MFLITVHQLQFAPREESAIIIHQTLTLPKSTDAKLGL